MAPSNLPEPETGLAARIVVGLLEQRLNSSNQLEAASKDEPVPEPVLQLGPALHLEQVLQLGQVLHLDLDLHLEPVVHLLVPVLQPQLDPMYHFGPVVHHFGLDSELAGKVLQCLRAPMVSWTS